jgi:hypothetical protein
MPVVHRAVPRRLDVRTVRVTGVYGGRNVVVPTCGTVVPIASAATAMPSMPLVLPWSVPMPSVV